MAQYMVIENNGHMNLWGESEEDGVKFFMLEELEEGELFLGKIPYEELKKLALGMVEIDPDTFEETDALIDLPLRIYTNCEREFPPQVTLNS